MSTDNKQFRNYIQPVNTANYADINTPFSFKDWKKTHTSVIVGQEYEMYNQYLADWFTRKQPIKDDFNAQLRLDYLNLLRQLQLFLTTEEKENWYNNVDLNSEKEVLLAIPFFAKKLKEIAVYYLKIRNEIKKTKIKYNLIGTNTGIVQQLQEQLLNSFTKKPNSYTTIPATIWSGIPNLSSVKDNLTIEIEELYDDHQYFDHSPSLPVSEYYNLSSKDLTNYFSNKNYQLSAIDWIYQTGNFHTQPDLLVQQLSSVEYEGLGRAIEFADILLTKYLGTEKYISVFAGLSTKTENFSVSLSSGNNFFYWPFGPYKQNIDIATRYQAVPLSSAGLQTIATPGLIIEEADTIFVKSVRGIEGAWLQLKPYIQSTQNVVTYIDGNTKTIFKYPFPGYGLSSENVDWTGPQLTYTPEFAYLDPNIKKGIEKEYWNYPVSVSAVEPIKINNTTLIDVGAYANTQYELADKVRQWKNPPSSDSSTYTGNTIESWLYKMLKTDIPVAAILPETTDNVILWPYTRLNTDEDFPTYIPSDIESACQPLPLSEIKLPFATACDALSAGLGDIIYKIPSYRSTENEAYEAAWLFGPKQTYDTYFEKALQSSLSHVFLPGGYTQFTWDGPDNTDINEVFTSHSHQPNCPFYNSEGATPDDHLLCNCGQTIFSPFGHPGDLFVDYNRFADFIAEDTQYPRGFDLDTWTDSIGARYDISPSFAWYQTNEKVGWGYGKWMTSMGLTTDKFYLRTGKRYVYYRSNTRELDPVEQSFPAYVIRYAYNTEYPYTTWFKAVKDENGTWVQTNTPSDMIIYPGDILLYKKAPALYQTFYTSSIAPVATAVNTGTIWSNYDYISLYPDTDGNIPTITYRYPSQVTVPSTRTTTPPPAPEPPPPKPQIVRVQIGWRNENGAFQTTLNAKQQKRGNWEPVFEIQPAPDQPKKQIGWRNKSGVFRKTIRKKWETNGEWTPVYETPEVPPTQVINVLEEIKAQTPITIFTSIVGVSAWILTTPVTGFNPGSNGLSGSEIRYIPNTFNFSFVPSVTGVYSVRAIAITSENVNQINLQNQVNRNFSTSTAIATGFYYINNIPSVTATFLTTVLSSVSTLNVPVPGFVINTPLYGWNYSTNTLTEGAIGARPFWAVGFNDKNIVTQYKGIQSWGTPHRLVDGHNIVTQPIISENLIENGDYIEYDRKYPTSFVWPQPTKFQVTVNEIVWNTIAFQTTTSSNLSTILDNIRYDLITSATETPSNIALNNIIDNDFVEVYYNAVSPFVWNISVTPEITETVINSLTSIPAVIPNNPWNSLPNRYYPTLALYPTLENLYSLTDSGGYFTPQNLGASVYLNKTFTTNLNLTSSALSGIFNDGTDYPSGRGLTKQDQPTPYTEILDNNAWLKEPIVSGPLAGTIKKSIAKKYQKFIPYQSEFETNPNQQTGLILPTSRQSPWGGKDDAVWTDIKNNPTSFTGVPNVSAWSNTQLLKQTDKQLDCWVTDVYGNQYGLYKNIKGVEPFSRRFIGGDLWTRKNSQIVSSASISLTGIFDTYTNTHLQNELYNGGIRKIDMFFNTLYVETSGTVLFEKVIYDYDNDYIYSITDDTRYLSLAIPVSASLQREITKESLSEYTFAKVGDTWFMPQEKIVYVSVCGLSGNILTPELYKLDLLSREFFKVFPNNNEKITINELSSLQLQTIDPPVLTYNSSKKQFLFTILGNNNNNKNNIIEFYIKNTPVPNLKDIIVYGPTTVYSNLPPAITTNLLVQAVSGTTTTYQINANNNPLSYTLTNSYNWLKLNNSGLFTFTPPTTGIFYIPFYVSNSVGPTYNSLTINVSS